MTRAKELEIPDYIKQVETLFNYEVIAYQLSEQQARLIYPKYKDESINWSQEESERMPTLNINLPFSKLILTAEFAVMANSRLYQIQNFVGQRIFRDETGKIVTDYKNKSKYVFNRQDLGNNSLSGVKIQFDWYNDVIYTLTDKSVFAAKSLPEGYDSNEKLGRNKYKLDLLDSFILVSFDIPTKLGVSEASSIFAIKEADLLSTDEEVHISVINAIKYIQQILMEERTGFWMDTPTCKVELVSQYCLENTPVRPGNKLLCIDIQNNFSLFNVFDIDWNEGKIYYLTSYNASTFNAIIRD